MSAPGWLDAERETLASERILDAAAGLFASHGVDETGMAEVATAAGCSRATVYRYFENRRALHTAFISREARRIARAVGAEIASINDPTDRLVEGVMASLTAVRDDETLMAWFTANHAGRTADLAQESVVIGGLVGGFVGATPESGSDEGAPARWLTRVIVSLLTMPGIDDDDERAMICRFVAPALITSRPHGGSRP